MRGLDDRERLTHRRCRAGVGTAGFIGIDGAGADGHAGDTVAHYGADIRGGGREIDRHAGTGRGAQGGSGAISNILHRREGDGLRRLGDGEALADLCGGGVASVARLVGIEGAGADADDADAVTGDGADALGAGAESNGQAGTGRGTQGKWRGAVGFSGQGGEADGLAERRDGKALGDRRGTVVARIAALVGDDAARAGTDQGDGSDQSTGVGRDSANAIGAGTESHHQARAGGGAEGKGGTAVGLVGQRGKGDGLTTRGDGVRLRFLRGGGIGGIAGLIRCNGTGAHGDVADGRA